ncbi:hypothetical protein J7337_005247 [Fusarium musae]|nr:hypothetical protein J7337_005247 [Fusarium musae]KAG9502420.1 hypothetical protein J7337_005247 [Fusarium musae]RBQ81822.1 hypothetical protein FVER14953_21625 [Fusarium verticillioides]RBQ90537.1 hypothetical protein FVER53263_20183 [Fusarium verticillioides]
MSCRNWESGVVVRISNPKNSSTVSASFSTSASAAGASSSTKVKAAEGQARSSVRAGKISAEPDKGCDTSQHNHHHSQMQKQDQKQKQKQEEGLTGTDAHTDSDMMSGAVFKGTVPIPMRRPGRRYREGEEPWFYSVQG